jgi:acetyltransferase-like isoleucine patch superfamily enzyme
LITNLLKFAANKYAYPHAQIAFGSRVAGNTVLGANVKIAPGCYVYDSTFGDHVTVEQDCKLFHSQLNDHVLIGQQCIVSNLGLESYSYVAERSQISQAKIGRFCSIGPEFLCGHGAHPLDFISTSPVFYSTRRQCGTTFADQDVFQEFDDTTMGHDIWIGARVFVRSGLTIGNGAVIAAGAVVVNDIPDYAVVGGVPAKTIRYRFDEGIIKALLELQWWNWPEPELRAASSRFAQKDVQGFLDWASRR